MSPRRRWGNAFRGLLRGLPFIGWIYEKVRGHQTTCIALREKWKKKKKEIIIITRTEKERIRYQVKALYTLESQQRIAIFPVRLKIHIQIYAKENIYKRASAHFPILLFFFVFFAMYYARESYPFRDCCCLARYDDISSERQPICVGSLSTRLVFFLCFLLFWLRLRPVRYTPINCRGVICGANPRRTEI